MHAHLYRQEREMDVVLLVEFSCVSSSRFLTSQVPDDLHRYIRVYNIERQINASTERQGDRLKTDRQIDRYQ